MQILPSMRVLDIDTVQDAHPRGPDHDSVRLLPLLYLFLAAKFIPDILQAILCQILKRISYNLGISP